jgi:hypothetical protein
MDWARGWLSRSSGSSTSAPISASDGPLLITHTNDHLGQGPLASFARRHDWTTPRSQHRVRMQRGRPVLAYVPDAKVLDVAASYARGSSLCAVEGFAYPLAGWAKAAGAIDLLSGETAAPSDQATRQALDGLHLYGNNGWTRGSVQTRRCASWPRCATPGS